MIRHLVLLHVAPTTPAAELAAIFQDLRNLKNVVPGLTAFAAGSNVSPEGLARGFSHAFTVDFASAEDRDAYLAHPAHQAAGARLVASLEGGLDGLLVVDFAVDQ